MNISFSYILLFCGLLPVLHSCSFNSQKEARAGGRPNSAILYNLPHGWNELPDRSTAKEILIGYGEKNEPNISITVSDRLDTRFPNTEVGCAESYKDGIKTVKDEEIEMEKIDIAALSEHNHPSIFRFHSKYYGDHLVSFILDGKGFICVELWSSSPGQRMRHTPSFFEVVTSAKRSSSP